MRTDSYYYSMNHVSNQINLYLLVYLLHLCLLRLFVIEFLGANS